jgi:hypothetical protein
MIILLLLSLVLFGLAVKIIASRIRLLLQSCKTYGTIESWKVVKSFSTGSHDPEYLYYAIVSFDINGTMHHVTSDMSYHNSFSPKREYPTGQRLAVRYNKNHPHDAHINTTFNLWFAPVVLLAFGGLLLFAYFHR